MAKRISRYDPAVIMSKIEREKRRRESAIKFNERQKAYKEKMRKEQEKDGSKTIDSWHNFFDTLIRRTRFRKP